MIGKSRQNVGEYLSLFKLPKAIRKQEIQQNIVPFNQLKQLAAKSGISDDEKIRKYQKLVKEYSTDKDSEEEAPKQNNAKDKPARDEEAIITKKFSAMTRKLDSTLTALGKFQVEGITDSNDRQTLADKLEQIIIDAQK